MKARQWAEIYNDLLTHQVELSYDLEQSFFRASPSWLSARTVVEVGAGNSYYAKMLSIKYPDKRFICVEKNQGLVAFARHETASSRIELINGSFESLELGKDKVDFVLARHVLSYFSAEELEKFVLWLKDVIAPTGTFLVIDAEDENFFVYPELSLLEKGNKEFKETLQKSGGNRSLRSYLPNYLGQNGFKHQSTQSLVVHSDILGRKYLMAMFMKAVAEIDHGSPLPIPIREEIDLWAQSRNSYLQYGLFGSIFTEGNP